MKSLSGIVHGKTIELLDGIDLPEGQQVEIVLISPASISPAEQAAQQAIARASGSLQANWTKDDDRILSDLEEQRKSTSYRDTAE